MEHLESRFPQIVSRLPEKRELEDSMQAVIAESSDWDALLDRWLEGLEIEKYSALALSGLGEGSHIAKLLEGMPEGCVIFCGEPDLGRAKHFCDSERGKRLLADERFFLGVGNLDEGFFDALSRFPVLEIENAIPLIFAPLFEENEAFYGSFFKEFARGIDYWRKLWGTNVIHSGDWQSNSVRNLKSMIARPDLGELSGRFSGETMVLVSAGPSLDESLEFVKSVSGSALIVAVNSSYRALRNAGITPHFVLAADPYESTAKGFQGVSTGGSILVAPFIVYPEVTEYFEERIVTWSESNHLAKHFRQSLGLEAGVTVLEQGTVSACAFDLAAVLGCRRIVMVGQDLAARTDGRTHASDSFYTSDGNNFTDLEACRWMPGNTIESVPVESKLYVYLKVFEKLSGQYGQKIELWNTSRLGAKIEGVPYLPLEEAFSKMGDAGNSRVEERFEGLADFVAKPRIEKAALLSELRRLSTYLQTACSQALGIAIDLENAPMEAVADPQEVFDRALEKKNALEAHVESEPALAAVLKEGQMKYEMLLFSRDTRDLDEGIAAQEKKWEELKGFCWAFAEGSFRLLTDLRGEMEDTTQR